MSKGKLFLIDGYAFIFRAFFAAPKLTTPDGIPIGAINSFVQMLFKLIEKHNIENIAVILDKGSSKNTHRHKIYQEYKAHRPPVPEDLIVQFPIMREAINAFGIKYIELEGYEADDLIASYVKESKHKDYDVVVVSSDKDLYQLLDHDNGISIYDPMKDTAVDKNYVFEKLGVYPDQVLDYLSLVGDNADNIPGVKGIGIKTAASLLQEYSTLDNIYANLGNIRIKKARTCELLESGKDNAFMSRELAKLKDDIHVVYTFRELKWNGVAEHGNELRAFFEKYALHTVAARYLSKIIGAQINISSVKTNVNDRDQGEIIKYRIYNSVDKKLTDNVLKSIFEDARYVGYVYIEANFEDDIIIFLIGDKCLTISNLKNFLLDNKGATYALIHDIFTSNFIKKVGENTKDLIKYLYKFSIYPEILYDIRIIAYIINSVRYGRDYTLIKLVKDHLDENLINNYIIESKVRDKVAIYSVLYPILMKKLYTQQQISLYYVIDQPLNYVLSDMEISGIFIDRSFLLKLKNQYNEQMLALSHKIYKEAGTEFNLASPKQLSDILFTKLKIPVSGKKNKSGYYTTNNETLEELSMHGFTIVDDIIMWRRLFKITQSYIDGLLEASNKDSSCIHTTFNNTYTSTGRLSSSSPNLQSIPVKSEEGSKIRNAFVARDGNVILSADYSQIEIRLLAHMANIEPLQKALIKGADIHALTASQVFGISLDKIDATWRRRAKAINFGIIYGISSFGLAKNLKISRTEAEDYIKRYFKQYPGIQAYMERIIDEAKLNGYVKTLFNRRCEIPEINSKNGVLRKLAERAAINAPLQGSAADIIRKAMVKLPLTLRKYLKLQIHDELLFEIPRVELESSKINIKNVMESVISLNVPLNVDISYGKSWGEADE